MEVAADAVAVLAHHQAHLGVDFAADQPIDDMDARLLQRRAQRMLLASSNRARNSTTAVTCLPLRTASMSAPTMRIAAGAVEGLFDGQHIRVGGRLLEKIHHAAEVLVGMVQQEVALADGGENVRDARAQAAATGATNGGSRSSGEWSPS
jgi:hypothetical protein